MVSGISTVGVKVLYAPESVADTKPTSGWVQLHRINSVGEISVEDNPIDSSALEDYVEQSIEGRGTNPGTVPITVNLFDDTLAEWTALKTAYGELSGGKQMWLQVYNPNMGNSYFIKFAPPAVLPFGGAEQNALNVVTMNCTIKEVIGYDAAVGIA